MDEMRCILYIHGGRMRMIVFYVYTHESLYQVAIILEVWTKKGTMNAIFYLDNAYIAVQIQHTASCTQD